MSDEAKVAASLPESATIATLEMLLHNGRDQVAATLGEQGWQGFERPLPQCLFSCVQAWPGLVIDVGANTGFYSLLAASASSENRVLAFEPDTDIIKLLVANIALNHLAGRVQLFPIALSDQTGAGSLYVPTKEHGLVETSSSLEADFKAEHSETREIHMDRLDDVLAQPQWASYAPQVIKIDVEGHEAAVLRGAVKTVATHRPIIFIEILERGDFNFASDFILANNYVDYQLEPQRVVEPTDHVSFNPLAWNHALVPLEKSEKFIACIGLSDS